MKSRLGGYHFHHNPNLLVNREIPGFKPGISFLVEGLSFASGCWQEKQHNSMASNASTKEKKRVEDSGVSPSGFSSIFLIVFRVNPVFYEFLVHKHKQLLLL